MLLVLSIYIVDQIPLKKLTGQKEGLLAELDSLGLTLAEC